MSLAAAHPLEKVVKGSLHVPLCDLYWARTEFGWMPIAMTCIVDHLDGIDMIAKKTSQHGTV